MICTQKRQFCENCGKSGTKCGSSLNKIPYYFHKSSAIVKHFRDPRSQDHAFCHVCILALTQAWVVLTQLSPSCLKLF